MTAPAAPMTPMTPVQAPGVPRLARFLRAREAGTLALVLLVFLLTTLKNHNFASSSSIQQLLVGASLIALLGVGETMVIVTRNIDLSVGSTLGLSAFVVGDLFRSQHIPVWSGFVIAIAIGAPREVPRTLDAAALAALQLEMQQSMKATFAAAKSALGL